MPSENSSRDGTLFELSNFHHFQAAVTDDSLSYLISVSKINNFQGAGTEEVHGYSKFEEGQSKDGSLFKTSYQIQTETGERDFY